MFLGGTTMPSISPLHTEPPFQRPSAGAPPQQWDMDSRIKDLLKQLREERVERAADTAKLRRDFALHLKDLGKLQEDMNAIRKTLKPDSPGGEGQVAKRSPMGQYHSGGTAVDSNSGTWSLDVSNATIPDGQTADVCGSIQEVVAVIETSQGTLKEDLQHEIQGVRMLLEGEQSRLLSRLEQVEMRLPHGSNPAELMDKVEKLEQRCIGTCIQELNSKLHTELRSCVQAFSSELRGEMLGDFAVRVASAEARTGAVEARLGDDIQRVSAEIRMRVNKLESAQLVQRIQSLEEEARRFEKKAIGNPMNDIDHALRMTFSEEKDTADCSRPAGVSLRPKAVEDKLDTSQEAEIPEGVPPPSLSRASVPKSGGLVTAALGQQQVLSARVMAHKGLDSLSENPARQAGWQARLNSSSLEAQLRASNGSSSADSVDFKGPVIHALPSSRGTSSCHSSPTPSGGGQSVNMLPGQRPHLSSDAQDRSMACVASPTPSASGTASTFGGGFERMSQDANGKQLIAQRLTSPLIGSRATNPLVRNTGSASSARSSLALGTRATGAGMSGCGSLTARLGAASGSNLNSKERGTARDGMRVRFAPKPVDSDASSSRPLDSGVSLASQHLAEQAELGYYTLAQLTDFRIWRKLPNVKPTEREIYLNPRVFKELFSMQKDEFAELPRWKRDSLKRRHGLF